MKKNYKYTSDLDDDRPCRVLRELHEGDRTPMLEIELEDKGECTRAVVFPWEISPIYILGTNKPCEETL